MLGLNPDNEATTRLHMMTEVELKKFAQKFGLDKDVPPGRKDFEELGRVLADLKSKGGNIAFKLPGQEASSCSMLADAAKKHLQKNDLFIMVQSQDQARLLELFPGCIGTDGTHRVLSYHNAKLITVNVTSYGKAGVTERGFPVAFVITTSEREEIHLAIIAQIQAAQKPDWAPKLLMSDMAFAAFNAWVKVFPELRWLFCVFHVWQAWIKKLKQATRPDGVELTQAEFSHLKGQLIREIKDLISPGQGVTLSWDDFNKRAELVRKLLWAFRLSDLATSWEQYLGRKDKWAPPARREAVDHAFGEGSPLPMLAVSNNSVERFFGVLKYILLEGKSALTISALLQVWILYGARIRINAVRAGISLALLHNATDEENEQNDIIERVISDDEAEDDVDDDIEEQAEDDAQEQVQSRKSEGDLDDPVHHPETRTVQRSSAHSRDDRFSDELLKGLDAMDSVVAAVREWTLTSRHAFASEKRLLTSQMGKIMATARVAMGLEEEVDAGALGPASIQPLIKQRDNYGPVPASVSQATIEALSKKKRERTKHTEDVRARLQAESFMDFSRKIMENEHDFAARVKAAQELASKSNFPVLRARLKKNTCMRICGLGKFNLGMATIFASWKKQQMIDAIVAEVSSRFSFSSADETLIGDFGVLTEDTGDLFRSDVICLEVNAVDNFGDPCVVGCDYIQAWVVRSIKPERVEVKLSCVQWGYLSESRKDLEDLKVLT